MSAGCKVRDGEAAMGDVWFHVSVDPRKYVGSASPTSAGGDAEDRWVTPSVEARKNTVHNLMVMLIFITNLSIET
jgi:hypothetical protein